MSISLQEYESVSVTVKRFDGEKSWNQEYSVPYEKGKTLVWLLTKIREEQDSTLNFTVSCLHAICGACGVKVNGSSYLLCSTPLDEVLTTWQTNELLFEPMANFDVVRDLVIDFIPKFERMKTVSPWLEPADHGSLETGFSQSAGEFKKIASAVDCILCGLCTSECEQLHKNDGGYLDPFIFNKAYRFAADSRDNNPIERISAALEGDLWKCVHCMRCTSVCPKEIDIAEEIAYLRSGYNTNLT